MERRIVLLRGINLGSRNRIAMGELREALSGAGYGNVRTYLQSGNVVLDSDQAPAALETDTEQLIAERFGLEIPVTVRTRDELAAVLARNPLREVATNPKRYQVSFLDQELAPEHLDQLTSLAAGGERVVALGRELYAWHPDGIARSKLSMKLASPGGGVKCTARNWNSVEALLRMADE